MGLACIGDSNPGQKPNQKGLRKNVSRKTGPEVAQGPVVRQLTAVGRGKGRKGSSKN